MFLLAPLLASVLAGGLTTVLVVLISRVRILPSRFRPSEKPLDEPIQILVLGDIGRSPRMQYHALSVVRHGGKVDLIGYKESARHPDLIGNPRVRLFPLAPTPEIIEWQPFFLKGPLKALWQFYTLFSTLAYKAPAARWIIVQNPPSIPTLHVCLIVSLLRGTKLLIDWHNYGWSILRTTKSKWHPFVYIYKVYERFFGRVAPSANLTVTEAMAKELRAPPYNYRKPIFTLHDRPASTFQPIESPDDRLTFLSRLPETKSDAESISAGGLRLIVSSTSWTPDEDFSLLLSALVSYAAASMLPETTPVDEAPVPILAIITGRGPQKAEYEARIKQLTEEGRLPGVRVLTAWLSTRDYASLLACADLGICLHKSSSGVDLPMKVVDMFGAGLPVVAYSRYESFGELVRQSENGCGFETGDELAEELKRLLCDAGKQELAVLRKGAVEEGSLRWDEEWDRVVAPVVGLSSS